MFPISAACFDEDKTFGAFHILIVQGAALTVPDGQFVCRSIDEFKCREDFRKLAFDYLIQWTDVGKGRQSKNDIIRGLRCRWSQYGHGCDDAKGPLSADEELLEVISCRVSGIERKRKKEVVPVLSLRRVDNWSSMVPSGRTTSRPRTVP